MPDIIHGVFEWDEEKNRKNADKHGIRFEEAIDIFPQDRYLSFPIVMADGEVRYLTVGLYLQKELSVVFTQRNLRVRIISARSASDAERTIYREFKRKGSTDRPLSFHE
jgi:uncharacterized DUF497 family protein